MVIVDNPDVVTALADPRGYVAAEFLNTSFVDNLAKQVH
jgi:hypothetical protein